MRVLLVSSWDTACGIAEHSALLKTAVETADPTIEILPCAEALDPFTSYEIPPKNHQPWKPDILHLNYQAALHSRWTPNIIKTWRESKHTKVVVTYHDSGVPNADQCKAICAAADYFVVHEPYEDLPGRGEYLRMGVSEWMPPTRHDGWVKQWPVLGTIGFPFPWKCYDELARVTAANGWALLLLAPTATDEEEARWRHLNPQTFVYKSFLDRRDVVSMLAGCDATAFTYVCHNTGQSGAILQGIAARKPVIALRTCRQFRSLWLDPLGGEVIRWCETFQDVAAQLRRVPIQRVDPGIVALAEQESWTKVGQRYAEIFHLVLA